MIKLYSWKWVPPMVRGYVRDIRVRWACEEAGLPYENETIDGKFSKSEIYRALQPFGQVPAIEDHGLKLAESGAILHYLGLKSEKLMPREPDAQARVTSWMFAALNSVEPFAAQWQEMKFFAKGQAWAKEREPQVVEILGKRLDSIVGRLDNRDYLEVNFTVADILMASVLHGLDDSEHITSRPVLKAYRDRCQARPAYKKALADHLASFVDAANPQNTPPGVNPV